MKQAFHHVRKICKQFPSFPPIFTTYKCTDQQHKDAFDQYQEDRGKAIKGLKDGIKEQVETFCAELAKDFLNLHSSVDSVQKQYGEMLTEANTEIHKYTEKYAEQQKEA